MRTSRTKAYRVAYCAVFAVVLWLAILIPTKSSSQQAQKQSTGSKPAVGNSAASPAPPRGGPSDALNPFDRYLASTKANRPEAALARFAKSCGVDAGAIAPKFAQRSGDRWKIVKDFNGALKDQEADFYHTLQVWQAGKRVVTEEWGMEADSGDYYRVFTCLENRRITSAELVNWNIPEDEDSGDDPGWGYQTLWTLNPKGKLMRASTAFLDLHEKPVAEPKLEADTKKDLEEEKFEMRNWVDLGYPVALLK
jgi:hypothetical protein